MRRRSTLRVGKQPAKTRRFDGRCEMTERVSKTAALVVDDADRVYTVTFNGRRFMASTRAKLAIKVDVYLRRRGMVNDRDGGVQ